MDKKVEGFLEDLELLGWCNDANAAQEVGYILVRRCDDLEFCALLMHGNGGEVLGKIVHGLEQTADLTGKLSLVKVLIKLAGFSVPGENEEAFMKNHHGGLRESIKKMVSCEPLLDYLFAKSMDECFVNRFDAQFNLYCEYSCFVLEYLNYLLTFGGVKKCEDFVSRIAALMERFLSFYAGIANRNVLKSTQLRAQASRVTTIVLVLWEQKAGAQFFPTIFQLLLHKTTETAPNELRNGMLETLYDWLLLKNRQEFVLKVWPEVLVLLLQEVGEEKSRRILKSVFLEGKAKNQWEVLISLLYARIVRLPSSRCSQVDFAGAKLFARCTETDDLVLLQRDLTQIFSIVRLPSRPSTPTSISGTNDIGGARNEEGEPRKPSRPRPTGKKSLSLQQAMQQPLMFARRLKDQSECGIVLKLMEKKQGSSSYEIDRFVVGLLMEFPKEDDSVTPSSFPPSRALGLVAQNVSHPACNLAKEALTKTKQDNGNDLAEWIKCFELYQ